MNEEEIKLGRGKFSCSINLLIEAIVDRYDWSMASLPKIAK